MANKGKKRTIHVTDELLNRARAAAESSRYDDPEPDVLRRAAEAMNELRFIIVRVNQSDFDRHVGTSLEGVMARARLRHVDGAEYGIVLAPDRDAARHKEPVEWYPVPEHWRR